MIATVKKAFYASTSCEAPRPDLLVLTDRDNILNAFSFSRITEIAIKNGYAVIIERGETGSDLSRVDIGRADLYAALDDQGFSMIDQKGFNSGQKADFMTVGGRNYHYIVNIMGLTSPKAPSPSAT